MKVSGIGQENSLSVSAGGGMQATDAVSKNLQNQIMNAQKQLQDLSSNQEMPIEEKMKKRQELQKQIAELNNQLRQHQIELRNEKKESQEAPAQEILGQKKEDDKEQKTGMSENSMKAMVSADTAIENAKSSGKLKSEMEGRANVLRTEIKLSQARGGSVEGKQAALDDLEGRLSKMADSQMEHLSKASEEMEKAAKADSQDSSGEKGNDAGVQKNDAGKKAYFENLKAEKRAATDYSAVNIRL